MSYMRFGKDSDVYCYSDGPVITLEVAGSRVFEGGSEDTETCHEEIASLKISTRPINLQHAGSQRRFLRLTELRDFLLELKSLGYRVPDVGLQAISNDIKKDWRYLQGEMLKLDLSDNTQVACFRRSGNNEAPYALLVDLKQMPKGADVNKMSIFDLIDCEYEVIPLKYAGEIFEFEDRMAMIEKMLELRDIGYEVSEAYLKKARDF